MALIPMGVLSAAASQAVRVSVAAYFMGGVTPAGAYVATADKITFATDSTSAISNYLDAAKIHLGAFSNSGVAAYSAGGVITGFSATSTVNKHLYSNDSRTTLGTGLSSVSVYPASFANSGVAGYDHIGRNGPDTGNTVTTVDKFAFSNDSRTTLGTGISSSRSFATGFGNVGVAGYIAGGRNTSNAYVTTVDKFAFSDDSRSTLGTGLSAINGATMSGFTDAGVAGYIAGGIINSANGTVDKFALPSDTRSTLATGMSVGNYWVSGASNSGVAGYAGCAGIGNTGASSSIDKFAYPSDTRSTITNKLVSATEGHGFGVSNEGIF